METRVSSQGSGQGQAADAKLRLMAVHAHPDDESSKGAATMARYVREGVEVLVATMTGGERGSVLNKAMDRPEVLADLPNIRRAEMARAREILGVEQRFLGFVDSGLPEGDPLPPLPEGSFALVPLAEAAAPLVRLVREFQPHVILTYDESGGYPHPDHIKTHQVAVEAFEAAADPDRYPEVGGEPWQPSKMYYFVTLPPGEVRRAARGTPAPRAGVAVHRDLRRMGGARAQAPGARPADPGDHHPGGGGRLLRRAGRRAARARNPDRPQQLLVRVPARGRARRVADRGLSSC